MDELEGSKLNPEEKDQAEGKVREELKTDKSGFMKVGDIVLVMMKRGDYCGIVSADGVISQSVNVIPRESDKEKGANVLTRSCLFRIENAMKITRGTKNKWESELKQSMGKVLTYGERIQLRHLHSMSFISINSLVMASEAGCLQVTMSEDSNEKSWFELMSVNKLRKEGEVIRYSDSVHFVMVNKKSLYFLHVEETNRLTVNSRAEVNASGNPNTWIVRRYTSFDNNSDFTNQVRTGDSFRIFHKISSGYLSTKENSGHNAPEVFIQVNNLTSNSLWEIQRTITFVGGTALWSENYRIKHVATGFFLQETQQGIVLTTRAYDDGTLFKFIQDQSSPIEQIQYGEVLAVQALSGKFLNLKVNDIKDNIMRKKNKKEKFKVGLSMGLENFTGVAFSFVDVPEEITAHVYKLALVNPFLSDFCTFLKDIRYNDPNFESRIRERSAEFRWLLKNILKHIINRVDLDVTLTTRQNAIRELGIIDLLLEIAEILHERIREYYGGGPVLPEVLDEVYDIIYYSIKTNQKNCKYLAQNEQVFISRVGVGMPRGVGRILKEVFETASTVTNIDESSFIKWLKFLDVVREDNIESQCLYLSILTSLCKSNGTGLLKFQSIALNFIANPLNDFTLVKFHILNKRPVIEFNFPRQQSDLKTFLDKNLKLYNFTIAKDESNLLIEKNLTKALFYIEDLTKSPTYSKYIACATDFLANICLSRHKKAIKIIPQVTGITLQYISLVIRNVNVYEKVRASFANMCRVLFIDIDPLLPCSYHKQRCFTWENLEKIENPDLEECIQALAPIRENIKYFWTADGGIKIFPERIDCKPGKSIVLVISFLKLTSAIIDFEIENEDFIEETMKPLCFFINKGASDTDHWSTQFIKDILDILEKDYYPSLENKLSLLRQEILQALDIILIRRQNLHVLELLRLYKENLTNLYIESALKDKFDVILKQLDWDVTVNYYEPEQGLLGVYNQEKSKVYFMDLYLLEMLFDVSGGKDKETHELAVNVLIKDLDMRKLLSDELLQCEILKDPNDIETYKSIVNLAIKLQIAISDLIQNLADKPDTIDNKHSVKDCCDLIQQGIIMYKLSKDKKKFQNLLYHSGIYYTLIKILYIDCNQLVIELMKNDVNMLYLYCKRNIRNQITLYKLVRRLIELIADLNVTQLLSEVLADCRDGPKGQKALALILNLIDERGFTFDCLRFLRSFLKNSNKDWIKSIQITVMKAVFNSKGLKNAMGDKVADVFAPHHFLDPNLMNNYNFLMHLELMKTIIACSVKNSFGILQGRKLISLSNLVLCLLRSTTPYEGKEVYLSYLAHIYFSRIDGEIEPEKNINILETLMEQVLIPDLSKFKTLIQPIIDIAKKGGFDPITKLHSSNYIPTNNESEVIRYWNYLSHKAIWCDQQSGILHNIADIFSDNTINLDDNMEKHARALKNILYEFSDLLQVAEKDNKEISFSRFIFAANACRESLPRTALYSERGPNNPVENVVISGIQRYIIHNKLSLEEAFANFDVDSTGNIEFEEFRIVVRKLLGNVAGGDIEAAFNEMDEDNSGSVKFAEFSDKIRKYFSKPPKISRLRKVLDDEFDIDLGIEGEIEVESLVKFTERFYKACANEDMTVFVAKVREKFIIPSLKSRDSSLNESISKLDLVFYKKRHKIYLVKMLRMMVPEPEIKEVIFDERDSQEIKDKNEFMKFQETLSDAGVLKIALNLINPSSPQDLVKEAVLLINSLLKFGNPHTQKQFLALLKLNNSSRLFSYIRNLLRQTRNLIIKNTYSSFLDNPDQTMNKILVFGDLDFASASMSTQYFQEKSYLVRYLLAMLQLCCENCNLPFQNYLRTQEQANFTTKQTSINIISEIALFLINIRMIGGNIHNDPETSKLAVQCFETLIDSCRGPCVENQLMLGTTKKLYKLVNTLFTLYNVNKDCRPIFKSAVRFISALLEGNFSAEIAKAMIDFIDFRLLADLALEIFRDSIIIKQNALLQGAIVGTNSTNQLMLAIRDVFGFFRQIMPELSQEEWEIICVGFDITIITAKLREKYRNIDELRKLCFSDEQSEYIGEPMLNYILEGIDTLGGYNESFLMDVQKLVKFILRVSGESDMNEAYEFYTSLISSVEIDKDGHIEKCYFQIPTCMIYLNERMRLDIIYGINRNSNEEKVKSFLFLCEKTQLELTHLQIISRIGFIGWMISRYNFFAKILFCAIICTNFIIVFTVTSINDHNYTAGAFPGKEIMVILGIFIIIVSLVMYILSILVSYPLIIFDKAHEKAEEETRMLRGDEEIQGSVKMQQVYQAGILDSDMESKDYTRYLVYVLFNLENLVNVLIVILAFLGWYNPFFYAIMMLDILRRSATLSNVLLVITKNKKALLLTLVLLIIVVYIYGVLGFSYLGIYYRESDGGNYSVNTYNQTLLLTVTSTLNNGVRAGGGIGDIIYPAYSGQEFYTLRIFIDITFFIIVIIILLNIIFGIIVDTFAELRDARRDIEHDIENFCFICGQPKHEFELRGKGWNYHIQIEHCIWSYLAYIIYIKKKPIAECDGIEKYVKGKLQQNDISFFPSTALCLIEGKERITDMKDVILERLVGIEEQLKNIKLE